MMKLELNTKLLNNVICPDTYNIFSDESSIENMIYDSDYPEVTSYDDVETDWDAWCTALAECTTDVIQNECLPLWEPYGFSGFESDNVLNSPRQYNFGTDWVDFSIEFDEGALDKVREKISSWSTNKDIHQYIDDHYRSRDGFWSYSPESYSKLREMFQKDLPYVTDQAWGEFLTLLLIDGHDEHRYQDELIYAFQDAYPEQYIHMKKEES